MTAEAEQKAESAEIREWLAEWLVRRGMLGRPLPNDFAEANFFQRCWVDSFGVVELIEETERRFGLTFAPSELDDANFGVVGRFVELVQQAKARSRGTPR